VRPWPPIEDPELRERLALDEAGFDAYLRGLLDAFPAREYEASVLARAVEYPWARPEGPYVFADGEVEELAPLSAAEREEAIGRFASDPDRHPLLAIGSNGAPEQLQRKLGHFGAAEDRTALVLTGWLDGFDVGAAAQPTIYGAMPATIFPSPGTATRAALLWVTAAQFTQLAWSEMSYRLGRLQTGFELDGAEEELNEVFVFVSRFGAFHMGDGPVALAAVPARDRSAPALTQEAILDAAAALTLGPEAKAEDLVRSAYEDIGTAALRAAATVRRQAIPFESERWTPFDPARDGGAVKR
jgi:hypothetical protein